MTDIPKTSFVVETNFGGIPVTLCSCGVLLYQPMAKIHPATCPEFLAQQAEEDQ